MFVLVVPVILGIVIVYAGIEHEPLSYGGQQFPANVEAFGWFIEMGKQRAIKRITN